ncbi:hypothetical protein CH298_13160 [Rhodococcoides fascians]|nr:hypothetical protein CH303_13040 [Rhodococcus fascians]OZF18236.1 hypothetical protein CH298_13160 [Rhodococcus fascians]OZF21687.1 hypothetical protein CH297_13055 [Rhodococcus fascians]OZF67312.1 hypothetical protein CH308_12955 [Rhodococcus fascians]OZF70501.1 hypothetical protein CH307_13150 [Rhodococcus fascians]
MLENIDGMLRGIVGSLEFIDPGAIDPDTVRRLTVGIRTSTNTIKRFAHLIEQHHAKKNAPDAAATDVEGNESIHLREEGQQ